MPNADWVCSLSLDCHVDCSPPRVFGCLSLLIPVCPPSNIEGGQEKSRRGSHIPTSRTRTITCELPHFPQHPMTPKIHTHTNAPRPVSFPLLYISILHRRLLPLRSTLEPHSPASPPSHSLEIGAYLILRLSSSRSQNPDTDPS